MITRRQTSCFSLAALGLLAAVSIVGCSALQPASNLVALTTKLRAANEVPPNPSRGTGTLDAVFDKNTNVLRWKLAYGGLTAPATAGHFHGPAAVGVNAGVALAWPGPIKNPMEGSATLTPAQAADLLAGRWYANIHTKNYPGGEIRGQMTVQN